MSFPITIRRAAILAGWLAVAAMLALASPGVKLAAADGEVYEDGPSCQAGSLADPMVDLENVIEQARQQALLQGGQAGAGDDDIVVLNNRGFNYGTPPAPDPSPIAVESAPR